jgi:lysophospholipase L1-like esterase
MGSFPPAMHADRISERAGRRHLSSRDVMVGVAFAAAALAVGLVVLEGLTRAVFDRNGMHYGIEMWKYARQVKQRSAVAAMSHEHAPNRNAVLMGVPVRTNSLGLRDREFPSGKRDGVRRVLVLGDSMTLGWGTREAETYPKVLEQLLNRDATPYEVINSGVGNYNSSQEVAYFRERGRLLQPDEVILGFYINDAEPTPSPNENVLARHSYLYVLASGGWEALMRNLGAKPTLDAYYAGLYDERNPGWRATREALVALSRLCRTEGVPLRVVIIPELHEPNEHYPFLRVHALVKGVLEHEGVPVLDVLDAFAGVDPQSVWVSPGDAHPNARGHAIIANAIYQAMRRDRHEVVAAGSVVTTGVHHD